MRQHGKRKKWASAEKLRIVLAGLQPNVEVSELYRRERINPAPTIAPSLQAGHAPVRLWCASAQWGSYLRGLAVENRQNSDMSRFGCEPDTPPTTVSVPASLPTH